jgi:hypothetical protein
MAALASVVASHQQTVVLDDPPHRVARHREHPGHRETGRSVDEPVRSPIQRDVLALEGEALSGAGPFDLSADEDLARLGVTLEDATREARRGMRVRLKGLASASKLLADGSRKTY